MKFVRTAALTILALVALSALGAGWLAPASYDRQFRDAVRAAGCGAGVARQSDRGLVRRDHVGVGMCGDDIRTLPMGVLGRAAIFHQDAKPRLSHGLPCGAREAIPDVGRPVMPAQARRDAWVGQTVARILHAHSRGRGRLRTP